MNTNLKFNQYSFQSLKSHIYLVKIYDIYPQILEYLYQMKR